MPGFHDVMGANRQTVPSPLWMAAEAMLDASLRGLVKGRLHVVAGGFYKVLAGPLLGQHAGFDASRSPNITPQNETRRTTGMRR